MSDDLVEQIAQRLLDIGAEVETGDLGGVDIANFPEIRLALAREVIRLMEWSRRNCWQHETTPIPTTYHTVPFPPGMAEIRGVHIHGMVPLTLPPDDWQP